MPQVKYIKIHYRGQNYRHTGFWCQNMSPDLPFKDKTYKNAQGLYSPVNCGGRGGDLLIQNAALKFVVLPRRRGAFRAPLLMQYIQYCSLACFSDTLNISSRVSFLISSLSNGCFSLIIFLHKFSRPGKSLLDTPLPKTSKDKQWIQKQWLSYKDNINMQTPLQC